jgi:hypothetical protein
MPVRPLVRGVKFETAADAYRWAEEIITIRQGGRSNAAMMELIGSGGIQKDYAFLDAITIRTLASKACVSGCPCPQFDYFCLFDWYLPNPAIMQIKLSEVQIQRIEKCAEVFTELLQKKGFMD